MATMTQMNLITRKEKLEEELRNVEKQVRLLWPLPAFRGF